MKVANIVLSLVIFSFLGVITYMGTMMFLGVPQQIEVEAPTRTINYDRPGFDVDVKLPRRKISKRLSKPDYSDVRIWYYDLPTDTYRLRSHKH